MYSVRTYRNQYEVYELSEAATGSWFRIVPERGGIVTSFGTEGVERLYLDEATLLDPTANIRGGIPVLFPICGPLPNGEYEWNGQTYRMKNHGIARTEAWEVVRTSTEGEASITLRLIANDKTRAAYPFEFELIFTYRLKGGVLAIEQEYRNRSDSAMPMFAGFHPYFATHNKAVSVNTDATVCFDYNDNQPKTFDRIIDMNGRPEAVALETAKREFAFVSGDGAKVKMTYGEDFRHIVIWSVENKPFVCVEPWMAKAGEFERREELRLVEPGTAWHTSLSIECESPAGECDTLRHEIKRLKGILQGQAAKGMSTKLRDALYE